LKLHLIAFGKLKTPGLAESAEYYRKLLGGFVTYTETELKPLSVPDKSAASRALIQDKEAGLLDEKLKSLLSPRGALYLLDEGGKARTTQHWADLVRDWESSSSPEIVLGIGSSLGFADSVRRRARGILSLGPQTLPHELARVVLLEQLYRAWSVTRGHPYHVQG
jgi:23S rRNA (pseudouridine1915-N3)-methyltransferase